MTLKLEMEKNLQDFDKLGWQDDGSEHLQKGVCYVVFLLNMVKSGHKWQKNLLMLLLVHFTEQLL